MGSEAATPAAPVVIAEIAARAAQETDGVVGLDGGPLGALATYGGGRRIRGVTLARHRQGPAEVTVRVNADYGASLPALGAAVRRRVLDELAAAGLNEDVRIEVAIVGVVAPGDTDAPALPA